MTIADVPRITLKKRKCAVTIEHDKITHNEKATNNEVMFRLLKSHFTAGNS